MSQNHREVVKVTEQFILFFQANILNTYHAELSLTALMCIMGMLEASVIALIWERKNMSVWKIHLDMKLLASIYGVPQLLSLSLTFTVEPFCVCVFDERSIVDCHTHRDLSQG